ncbi:MAG: MarR family transcriptional regulator [Vicinamibacterales bacterium]
MSTNHRRPRHAPLTPELDFLQLLWAVAHCLETASKRMQSSVGVTGPQRLALRLVGLRPGLSAGELAATLHVHPSTLTGVLHRLVTQGLVARTDDPDDARRAVLRLTPRGAAVNARRSGTVEAAVADTLRAVGERDRRATTRMLEYLAGCLGAADARPPARDRRASTRTARSSAAR